MVSHLNKNNSPTMVDVGDKNITQRIAEAEGEVIFDKNSFKKIESLKSKKVSIKNIAILAGIMGSKETSRLIPLCHNIPIDSVNIDITKNLKNLKTDLNNSVSLFTNISKDYTVIAESGIKTSDYISMYNDLGIFSFLIGESILKSKDYATYIKKLLNHG